MKFTSLQFSFCLSLIGHAVLFGAVAVGGLLSHRAAVPEAEQIFTLTLVAAPDEPALEETKHSDELVSPTLAPSSELRSVINVLESVAKAEPTPDAAPPPQLIEAPNPITSLSPQAKAVNDSVQTKPVNNRELDAAGYAKPGRVVTPMRAQPNYLKNPEPIYPLMARRHNQQGLVLLTVMVTAKGGVSHVELKQSSGFPVLDEAALQAVRRWEFEPARIGSLGVESQIEVPVRFILTN